MGGLLPKPVTKKETEDGAGAKGCFSFGVSSMQGWRENMEDAHMAIPDFDPERELGLFGVFDGHGGSAVAKVAAATFPNMLSSQKSFSQGRYSEALYEAFLALDEFLDSPAGRAKEQELMKLLESGELDPEDLEEEDEEDEEEEPIEDDETSGSAWANGVGPDGMGCTAVVALLRGGSKPE
ncbi:unnamed protein product, partial [Durusdinium trenchii]